MKIAAAQLALLRLMDPNGIMLESTLDRRKLTLMAKLQDAGLAVHDGSVVETWDTTSTAYKLTDKGRKILKENDAVPPRPPKLTLLQLAMLEEAEAGSVIDPKDHWIPEDRLHFGQSNEEIPHVPGMLVLDSFAGALCYRARVLEEKELLERKHNHRPNPGHRYNFYELTQAGRDVLAVRAKGAITREVTDESKENSQ